MHNFDRRSLAHAGARADPPDNWIEYRMQRAHIEQLDAREAELRRRFEVCLR